MLELRPMGTSWLGLMKHSTANDRGAHWLCASRQPSDVLTTETGDGQVDKLLRGMGLGKTEAALYGPGQSRIRPGMGVCPECRGIGANRRVEGLRAYLGRFRIVGP